VRESELNASSLKNCTEFESWRMDPDGVWSEKHLRFPGTGREYPLAPHEARVVATQAIDHREVHPELGLPDEIVHRQPFPGPGLAVRIIGEVTPSAAATLRQADAIVREELRKAGLERQIWQSFAVLPDIRTVGVMGDERTYGRPVVIRAVTSADAMTADWARLPHDVLEAMSSRVIAEVGGVNRVVYDVTSKPPATIEWE